MTWRATAIVGLVLGLSLETAAQAQGQLPGAPRNVAAVATGATVTVSWDAPPTGAPIYYYVIDVGYEPGVYVASVPIGPVTQFSVDIDDGVYYLRVHAVNAAGQGPPSPEVSVTVGPGPRPQPPSAPQNLIAGVTPSSVTFNWDPPADGLPLTGYVLYAGHFPGTSDVLQRMPQGNVNVATFPSSAVPPGTYFVRVAATNAAGEGPVSNEVSITVSSPAPPAGPSNLTGNITNDVLTLTWLPPPGAPSGIDYTVYIANTPGGTLLRTHTTATTLSLQAGGTLPGVYYFRVTASTAFGESAPSNEISLVYNVPVLPDPPQNLSATFENGTITLNWSAPLNGGPIIRYEVWISQHYTGGGGFRIGGSATLTWSRYFGDPGPGTYYFVVYAINGLGMGAPAIVSVTVGPGRLPLAPSNLTADVYADTLDLLWNPDYSTNPPNTGQFLYVGTSPGASDVVRISLPPYTDYFSANIAGVTPGFYYFRVTAANGVGEGPPSNEVRLALGGYCVAPSAPALTGSSAGTTVSLAWTTPAGGPISGYTLLVSVGGGPFQEFGTFGPVNTASGEATPGTYRVRIVANAPCGRGAESNTVTVTVP